MGCDGVTINFFLVSFAGCFFKTSLHEDQNHPPAGGFHHRHPGRYRRPCIHCRNNERPVGPGLRHQLPLSRRIRDFGRFNFERTAARPTIFRCGIGHRGSRPHLGWVTDAIAWKDGLRGSAFLPTKIKDQKQNNERIVYAGSHRGPPFSYQITSMT